MYRFAYYALWRAGIAGRIAEHDANGSHPGTTEKRAPTAKRVSEGGQRCTRPVRDVALARRANCSAKRGFDERVLVAEVPVDRSDGDPSPLSDICDTRGVHAAPGAKLECGLGEFVRAGISPTCPFRQFCHI